MFKKMSGILMIFFLLSVYVAPIYGETTVNSQDLNDSVHKVLNHIKSKVSDVSDYECSQLLNIMYNHSNQHQGFEFYVEYISGNDVDDLYHKAPYYRQYIDYWDNELNEYNKMTPEERVSMLYVVDDKAGKIDELIKENNTVKLSFCDAKSLDSFIKLNKTSGELSDAANSKSLNIDKIKKLKNKFDEDQDKYYDDFIKASMEYEMQASDYNYDSDAYMNALNVRDEICKSSSQQMELFNGFDPETKRLNDLRIGDLVQFKIDQNNDQLPIYKYYMIKDINNSKLNIMTLDLSLQKNSAEEIIQPQYTEKRGIISTDILTNENTPYFIRTNITRDASVNCVFRAYRTDPTSLQSKIQKISRKPNSSEGKSLIAGIVIGAALIITGIVLIIVGACLIAGIITSTAGGGILAGGITTLLSGTAILASTASVRSGWDKDDDDYKQDNKLIEDIIKNHNRALFN
ncbi:MAG: hypothetical protein LBD03_06230 [Methanobrevibacter sp.]|jgi:hypothetical protein|nr:hypothetical protein [Candidatus Methanovirga procula]